MLRVYFDRNVFSALSELEGGISAGDVEKVKQAVRLGTIRIFGSPPLFEETITTLGRSEEMYDRHMAMVFELVDKQRMVKHPRQLLLDDCYYYAVGLAENDRTIPIPAQLRKLLDLSKNRGPLNSLTQAVKLHRGSSASSISDGMGKARADYRWKRVGRPDNFDELWNGLGEHAVTFWVDICPRNIRKKCYKRGIKKMLEIKSLRFFALYYLSIMHTSLFGLKGDPRKVKHGDIGDWFHVVCAASAHIFVTMESKSKPGHLGYILSLKPTPNFEVLNLNEFLKRIE